MVRLVRVTASCATTSFERGSELRFFNYRDTHPVGGGQVDDAPYGGGAGMVLRVDVVDAALNAAYSDGREPSRVVLLAPVGPPVRRFDGAAARRGAAPRTPLRPIRRGRRAGPRPPRHGRRVGRAVRALRGRAGGDGGHRRGDPGSFPAPWGTPRARVEESFSEALGGAPEYPHYTRPASYRGWDVPEVLVSGDHARVREWRLEQSRQRAAAARES